MENGLNGNLTKNPTNIYQAQVAYYGETTDKFDVKWKIIDNLHKFISHRGTIITGERIYTALLALSHIENRVWEYRLI